MANEPETAEELRDLADQILVLARGHRAYPMADAVIRNAVDHLRAIAQAQGYRYAALVQARRAPTWPIDAQGAP